MTKKTTTERGFCAWHPEHGFGDSTVHANHESAWEPLVIRRAFADSPYATIKELLKLQAEGWRIVPVTMSYEVEE